MTPFIKLTLRQLLFTAGSATTLCETSAGSVKVTLFNKPKRHNVLEYNNIRISNSMKADKSRLALSMVKPNCLCLWKGNFALSGFSCEEHQVPNDFLFQFLILGKHTTHQVVVFYAKKTKNALCFQFYPVTLSYCHGFIIDTHSLRASVLEEV